MDACCPSYDPVDIVTAIYYFVVVDGSSGNSESWYCCCRPCSCYSCDCDCHCHDRYHSCRGDVTVGRRPLVSVIDSSPLATMVRKMWGSQSRWIPDRHPAHVGSMGIHTPTDNSTDVPCTVDSIWIRMIMTKDCSWPSVVVCDVDDDHSVWWRAMMMMMIPWLRRWDE